MQVVILAGGLGTRLKPLTETIPKPMVLVNDEPFLLFLIQLLKKNNFNKILLLVGYLSNIIEDYFGDGSKFGIKISYSHEKEPMGTAGALKNASALLENNFLLLNGDTYLDLGYKEFLEFSNIQKRSIITIAAYNGLQNDDLSYNMEVGYDNVILDYSKSLKKNSFNAIDAGVYYINKTVLDYIYKGNSSLEEHIFPRLVAEGKMSAYKTKQRFFDIGTMQRLNHFKNNMS